MATVADPWPAAAEKLLKLLGLAAALWLCVDAGLGVPEPGLSTFGRPPDLFMLYWIGAFGAALLISRAQQRLQLARRLTLILLVATLLDGRMLPAAPGITAVLLGVTLVVAGPYLRVGPAARCTILALLLALPALFGGLHPHGGWIWMRDALPPLSMALLLPSLFQREETQSIVLLLLVVTAMAVVASGLDYFVLATRLDLPLTSLANTRLHILGLHPNLAVPHLVVATVLGASLTWCGRDRFVRTLGLLCTLTVLGGLFAVGSRTGHLGAALAIGLFIAARRGRQTAAEGAPSVVTRLARWVHPLAALAIVALLIVPAAGLNRQPADVHSSMATKAVSFRAAMWEVGQDTLAAAPWTGFGPNTFYVQGRFARSHQYDGLNKDDHPHNVVLAVGQSLGWGGLAALAWLVFSAIRRPRHDDPVTLAVAAGLLTVLAANAIDLGGATQSLYPALVFLLLGLRDIGEKETRPAPTGFELLTVVIGVAALCLGLAFYFGERDRQAVDDWVQQRLASPLDRPPAGTSREEAILGPPTVEELERVHSRLDWARTLLPYDPRVAAVQARLAQLTDDRDGALAATERAARLMQDFSELEYRRGRALLDAGSDLDEAAQALHRAMQLDPHGKYAWRVHLTLSALQARSGDRDAARDSLVEALILHPGAAAEVPRRDGVSGPLQLTPDAPGISVESLLDALQARREAVAKSDPAMGLRLALRPVEVAMALSEFELATERAHAALSDRPVYLASRLALIARAEGRWDDSVALLDSTYEGFHYQVLVDEMESRARATHFDAEAFEAVYARVLQSLPDITWEAASLARMLEARQRAAERQGEAHKASRLHDALTYAQR